MKHILVVDDYIANRELLCDILSDYYEVDEAENGQEAIDKIAAKEDYKMILLDLVMPVVDGFGVLEYMKANNLTDKYPVIIISGDSGAETESRCFDYGISDFIAKPFKEKIILKRISNAISLKEAITRAEAENNSKTKFLFNMSHDIRTPMNAIVGFTKLLEKHLDDRKKSLDYIKKIKSANAYLLSLINNVLEMSRIASGNVFLEEKSLRVDNFVSEINNIIAERMKQKNISFTFISDVEQEYLFYDKLKLNEIILNLLSNAFKYTLEGGFVTVNIKELPYDREDSVLIETKITDTGIGMTEEFLPHVFDEFSRETDTTNITIEGTGLGMPIVKKLVKLMKGNITVESKLGEGTTFTVTIPHRIGTCDELEVNTEAEYHDINLTGKRILLAEDNDFNAEIAIEILGEDGVGYFVERAENGQVCIDMLNDAADDYYDLILMDVQMPVIDGYAATRSIRSMDNPVKKAIPIIAMTANAFEEDKQKALNAGMNAHTTKPIDIGNLMNVLGKILKN